MTKVATDTEIADAQPALGLRGYRTVNPDRTEAQRRAIVLAAAEVFAELGYEGSSIGDIAKKLGVSRGVVYYQFRSKEELFVELCRINITDATDRLEAVLAQGGAPEDHIRAAVTEIANSMFLDLDKHSTRLVIPKSINRASQTMIRGLQRRFERRLQEVLAEGVAAGVFVDRDPKLMSFLILRAVHSIALWYQPGGAWTREYVIRETTEQMVAGVLRQHGQTSGADRAAKPRP